MTDGNEHAFPNDTIDYGLTKREYFAALAMSGLLSDSMTVSASSRLPNAAVEYADRLIDALNEESK